MAQIMLVASGKGGVGKSTVTCSIAKALKYMGKRVLIIDGDAGLRCQDILLDLTDRVVYDWGDVICGNIPVSDAVIEELGEPHLIAAPLLWSEDFSAEAFKKMTEEIAGNYDYVFIDAPAGIGPGLQVLSKAAKLAIVVSSSDAAGVRGACAAGDILKSYGVLSRRLVINSVRAELVRKGILPELDSVIDRTEIRLIGILPYEESISQGAAAGRLDTSKCRIYSKAASAIARRITGENVPITKF